ncbi:hypothetical protein A9Q02_11965 [Candidatus Chloroploca asiatica]|uniref:Methylenetetrahydrofolate reductase n=2 Tax=Candidatus Chloroploca asiatica TaxID=1506545 RepID=A0A2H3KVZ3_9CHLR|nr:hypothetical protein A9Q02_11965 [Candidatus Chloroploca asiatica]
MFMSLETTMADPQRFALLYGTTPPRADAPADRVLGAAARLAERVADLPLDGLVVYDVQDESARTSEPRPFPFLPTIDSPPYATLLRQLTHKPVVTYKCIATENEQSWPEWLDRAAEQHKVRYLSLVGLSSAKAAQSSIALSRATELAAAHPAGFVLGGVAIAERHGAERSESLRLIQKAQRGIRYFISQAVYDAEPTIRLLGDYVRDCAARNAQPQRMLLDFVPVGRPQTMNFMRWLGIAIPDTTAAAILDDPAPLSRSIAVCRDLLRRILDQPYLNQIPLGIVVESVSINKAEIGATIELIHTLRDVAHEYGLPVS